MTIPKRIEFVFDDFCEGCEVCKVTTEDCEETDERGYLVDRTLISCDHLEARQRAFWMEGKDDA